MLLMEARDAAIDRMEEFHLTTVGWKFKFSDTRTAIGDCHSPSKTIRLSRKYVFLNTLDVMMDTINHEIAHALVGTQFGHGKAWRVMASEIGAEPRATNINPRLVRPGGKYEATCFECGKVHYKDRLRKDLGFRCRCLRGSDSQEVLQFEPTGKMGLRLL